jgi:phosphoenolpyruvate-protein kinase (PTS system EI component)
VTVTDDQLGLLLGRLDLQRLHEGRLIVEAHRMMLRDDEIVDGARRLIEQDGIAAECAVRRVIDRIAATFHQMEDPYLRERGADIEAIGERLLRTSLALPEPLPAGASAPGTIGVGSALSPIDALHLPRSGLVGFASESGGKTSHAAIILRSLDLPFVVGVRGLSAAVRAGDTIVVDGWRGEVVVRPDCDMISKYEARRVRDRSRLQALKSPSAGAHDYPRRRAGGARREHRSALGGRRRARARRRIGRPLFPLVSGVSELDEARRLCAGVVDEPAREGVSFAREMPIGLMIETPSAALTTDHLAGIELPSASVRTTSSSMPSRPIARTRTSHTSTTRFIPPSCVCSRARSTARRPRTSPSRCVET